MTAASIALFLGAGAALVVISGVVPVRASSGHWAPTAWLLDFAKRQSVRTYSLGIEAPPLGDGALVVRGGAHYAIGCEPCHGSPEVPISPVMGAMTAHPPQLDERQLGRWAPAELFSIVKHGIKFTGMPAWPAQPRDDEVWQVVAFLARMPQMTRAEYRRVVGRDAARNPPAVPAAASLPAHIATLCIRCHGSDGMGRDGIFPAIAGQRSPYLYASLRAFAERSRFSGTMSEIAARLSDADMRTIASYYGQLPGLAAARAGDSMAMRRGAEIAARGILERDVPACMECHGPSDTPRDPAYPRLSGQHAGYLAKQLDLLKSRRRGGSPRVNLMHAVVDRLTPEDMQDVARYYAGLSGME